MGVGTGFAAEGGLWHGGLADRWARVAPEALPTAVAVARIAAKGIDRGHAGVAPERLEPTYLRDKVALTAAEQAAARAVKAG
jgi:tRNA threonylcarbamoyladenosine biosynthesis protein TsaB